MLADAISPPPCRRRPTHRHASQISMPATADYAAAAIFADAMPLFRHFDISLIISLFSVTLRRHYADAMPC